MSVEAKEMGGEIVLGGTDSVAEAGGRKADGAGLSLA